MSVNGQFNDRISWQPENTRRSEQLRTSRALGGAEKSFSLEKVTPE